MLPTGVILLWYGSVSSIPSGFTLCDGTAGTPDLRDRFLVGAGSTYAVGATGGSITHIHAFTGDGHTHDIVAGAMIGAGTEFATTTDSAQVTGNTDPGSSLPPYHALCYIMKT